MMAKSEKPGAPEEGGAEISKEATAKTFFEDRAEDDGSLVEVIVAAGRSVWDGSALHMPGTKLTIDRAEADALRRKGAVVDPDAIPVPKGIGPSFAPESGPKIVGV